MRTLIVYLLLATSLCGCSSPPVARRSEDNPKPYLDQEQAIQVTVCAYIIQKVLVPDNGAILYILADDKACRNLMEKFPSRRILCGRPDDLVKENSRKKSLDTNALVLSLGPTEINGNQASASVQYGNRSLVTFYFKLELDDEWRIKGRPIQEILD